MWIKVRLKITKYWHLSWHNYNFAKFFGSTILLLAFVSQWSLTQFAQGLKAEWEETSRNKSSLETHSLLCQLMYQASKNAGTEDLSWLKKAAEKNVIYIIPNLGWKKELKKDISHIWNSLMYKAKTIESLDDYNQMSVELSQYLSDSAKTADEKVTRMAKAEKISLWVYVFLYFLGSAVTINGLWLEYTHAEAVKQETEKELNEKGVDKKAQKAASRRG